MLYLIDGYNLAHALGVMPSPAVRKGGPRLSAARRNVLDQIARGHGSQLPSLTVIFDGQSAPPGVLPEQEYKGIRVLFSQDGTADDLIEDLLRHLPAPGQVTLVSDDRRLRRAAEHRRCRVLGCLAYLEQLRSPRRVPSPATRVDDGSPSAPDPADEQYWLKTFADVDNETLHPDVQKMKP